MGKKTPDNRREPKGQTVYISEDTEEKLTRLNARGVVKKHALSRAIDFFVSLTDKAQDVVIRGIREKDDADTLIAEIKRLLEDAPVSILQDGGKKARKIEEV